MGATSATVGAPTVGISAGVSAGRHVSHETLNLARVARWLAPCSLADTEDAMRTMVEIGLLFFFGSASAGCASLPLPQGQIERYEASVARAKQVGALTLQADEGHRGALGFSQSKEHLVLADEELAVARDMAHDGDTRSILFLARAQSDVDLAIALACEQASRQRSSNPADRQPDRRPSTLALCKEWRTR